MSNQAIPKSKPRIAVWKREDDELLRKQINIYGLANWKVVAKVFQGNKSSRQCRHRWTNNICNFKDGEPWTPAEDHNLIASQQELGNKWTKVCRYFMRILNLFMLVINMMKQKSNAYVDWSNSKGKIGISN